MKHYFISGLLAVLSSAASAATVPSAWYQLPENTLPGIVSDSSASEEPSKELTQQLDAIFTAQTGALESSELNSSVFTAAPKGDRVPWRFVSFMGDLSVTLNGSLGVLAWKGTPGVTVAWQKKESFAPSAVVVAESEEAIPNGILLSAETSPSTVESEIDTVVRVAMASHRVSNEGTLRRNFREAVGSFMAIGQQIDSITPASSWETSRIRVDLVVEASGKVSFSPSAGANLRVRLEWFKVPGKKPSIAAMVPKAENKWFNLKGLNGLMTALSQDIAVAAASGPLGPQMEAKSIRVGLGVTAAGNVGLAKGSAQAVLHLYFSKTAKKPLRTAMLTSDGEEEPLYMVDDDASPEHIAFSQSIGNLAAIAAKREGQGKQALYRLDRAKFRKGMKRAVKIGHFFARHALKRESKKWKLKQIKSNFEVSITGTVGLATIGGLATAEISFDNKNF